MAIGTRWDTTGDGIRVTGREHLIRAHIGRLHIMMAENTTAATGKVSMAGSSTITIGIAIETGTIGTSTNAIMTMTMIMIMITIMITTMITTTTKQSPLPRVCGQYRAHAIRINP